MDINQVGQNDELALSMAPREMTPSELEWYESIRAIAQIKAPYISDLLYLMKPLMVEGLGKFAYDDKCRLYVSRSGNVKDFTLEEYAWCLIHECIHIFRDHSVRRDYLQNVRNAQVWNACCDAEINDDLSSIVLKRPRNIITNRTLNQPRGRIAEVYYHDVPVSLIKRFDGTSSSTKSCENAYNAIVGSMCGLVDNKTQSNADSYEQGRSESEIETAVRSSAQRIIDAGKDGSVGDVPDNLVLKAQAILAPPAVDWSRVIRQFISTNLSNIVAGSRYYTYRRVNRRADNDAIAAGMCDAPINVTVIIDTSGSMSELDLGIALNEINALMKERSANVSYVCADARTKGSVESVSSISNIELLGGGGTDMGCAIDDVADRFNSRNCANFIVVITDGDTPWEFKTKIPVFAVIINEDDSVLDKVPANIEKVYVKTQQL